MCTIPNSSNFKCSLLKYKHFVKKLGKCDRNCLQICPLCLFVLSSQFSFPFNSLTQIRLGLDNRFPQPDYSFCTGIRDAETGVGGTTSPVCF